MTELADLDDKTFFIANDGRQTYWLWLQQVYGFKDDQAKPYTFNPAPFLADTNSVQQGYVTSEPFAIKQQGGFDPVVLMMADFGYDTYATTMETSQKLVDENPDLVQRFVNATIEGWYNYLYGDNAKANAMIKADNPEMTDEQIAFSIAAMKQYGIVDSGDARTMGIGAMTDARWESFFTKVGGLGRLPAGAGLQDRLHHQVRQSGPRARPAEAAHRRVMAAADPNAAAPVVALQGVHKVFANGTQALAGLDLAIGRHEFVSLLGPSGCGKSTVLRLIAGLARVSRGRIDWPGGEALGDIGFVFQDPTLMPWATVFDNVWLPLRLSGRKRAAVATRWLVRCRWSVSRAFTSPIRANCPAA